MTSDLRPPERPFVWVNCAVSLDGKLALAGGKRAALSGPEDLQRVQKLRASSDGVLVGVGTVLADDPSLRVHWELLGQPPGPSPTRVILDSTGRLPSTARVLDGSQPTLVATTIGQTRKLPAHVGVVEAGRERVDLPTLLRELARRGMTRLMVEGGAEVLRSVLQEGIFDRFTVYVAPVLIGDANAPSLIAGPAVGQLEEAYRLRLVSVERLGPGYVATFAPALP